MNGTRWWENYLVRYFLPSIFGMLVIWVVVSISKDSLPPVFEAFPTRSASEFDSPRLILWALLGSLYCYICSYPVLVFHATRCIDYSFVSATCSSLGIQGRFKFLNPYFATFVLFVCIYIAVMKAPKSEAGWWIIAVVVAYASLQAMRLILALNVPGKLNPKASIAYAYLWKLSRRRVKAESIISTQNASSESVDKELQSRDNGLVTSYRHLREHGNTAFIILLEVICAPMLYESLQRWNEGFYGVWLLAIWIMPAVLTYAFAQNLEYRFSWYGKRD